MKLKYCAATELKKKEKKNTYIYDAQRFQRLVVLHCLSALAQICNSLMSYISTDTKKDKKVHTAYNYLYAQYLIFKGRRLENWSLAA